MNSIPEFGANIIKDGAELKGVQFAIYSSYAESITVAVYHPATCKMKVFKPLVKIYDDIWVTTVSEALVGDYYVFHVDADECCPHLGEFYNHRHGVLDPYAKKVIDTGQRNGLPQLVGEVVEDTFDWQGVTKPEIPWHSTIIYESHIKGLTRLNDQVPAESRGTYLGVCDQAVIEHIQSLGITTLELMPCQAMLDESLLQEKGLTNYWGYNPVSFFALSARYAVNDAICEFKTMVRELHRAGIEVIIDLVFNHTAEGNLQGPMINLKGIDCSSYYLLNDSIAELFENYTGCGNTLDASHPKVIQIWLDALRHWFNEFQVDGFRFDLGVTLGRKADQFDSNHPFFCAIRQDPDLKQAKMIFEPWDLGPHGYQLGKFPPLFAEWNGAFRDSARSYIRGDGGALQAFSSYFVSSFDQYFQAKDRRFSSINFITAHDGFTLHDLVSYQEKHNEINGEQNRDGCNDNTSRNYGVEGETEQIEINRIRSQQKKNFLTVLALAKGIPMLLMGDEMGRTQRGNNNAYCQDNEISWLDWKVKPEKDFRAFWKMLIDIRKQFFWIYEPNTDIVWFTPEAEIMSQSDWEKWYARSVACCFKRHTGECFVIILNMHDGEIRYQLPMKAKNEQYVCLLDTCKQTQIVISNNESVDDYLTLPHSISAFYKEASNETDL